MRDAFIKSLIELAEKDERVALLTGDLGFGVVEKFENKFPDRFWNWVHTISRMWAVFRNVNNAIDLFVRFALSHCPAVNVNVRHTLDGFAYVSNVKP
jgi:hypothetical protein